jgi:hypothetical protein
MRIQRVLYWPVALAVVGGLGMATCCSGTSPVCSTCNGTETPRHTCSRPSRHVSPVTCIARPTALVAAWRLNVKHKEEAKYYVITPPDLLQCMVRTQTHTDIFMATRGAYKHKKLMHTKPGSGSYPTWWQPCPPKDQLWIASNSPHATSCLAGR